MPKEVIEKLRKVYENEIELIQKQFGTNKKRKLANFQKRYFGKFDHLLDSGEYGPVWLVENDIAQVVFNKTKSFDNKRYDLITMCIMPNHIHLLFNILDNIDVNPANNKGKTKKYIVADTMRLIKGATARECNLLLERSGSFWHHESYDHYVRNDRELRNMINYIIQNPVKAGLVNNWTKWKWTYLSEDYLDYVV